MTKDGKPNKRRIRIPKPKCGTYPRAFPKATKQIGFRIGRVMAYGWVSTWGIGYIEVRLILGVGKHRIISLSNPHNVFGRAPDKDTVAESATEAHATLFKGVPS